MLDNISTPLYFFFNKNHSKATNRVEKTYIKSVKNTRFIRHYYTRPFMKLAAYGLFGFER